MHTVNIELATVPYLNWSSTESGMQGSNPRVDIVSNY